MKPRALAALLAVLALVAAACGTDDAATTSTTSTSTTTTEPPSTSSSTTTSTTSSTTSTTTSTSTTSTSTTTTSTTMPPTTTTGYPSGTGAQVAGGEPFADFALLTDVRIAQHADGFTRVVFDFEEGSSIPWWKVEYAEGPFVGAGGPAVDVDGVAYLKVTLSSSTVDLSGDDVETVYPGPDRIEETTNSMNEMVIVEDFEGVLTWVIGLQDGEHPFVVGTRQDPPRVFIDIADRTA